MRPDLLEEGVVDALHAERVQARVGDGGEHRPPIGTEHAQLPAHAVERPARPRAPALPAVAPALLRAFPHGGVDLLFTHLPRIPAGDEPVSAPQQALRHPVHVPQAHAQAGAALAAAGGVPEPVSGVLAAQRVKQALLQEVDRLQAADAPHQRGQRLGAARVVGKRHAGRVVRRAGEEAPGPVLVDALAIGGAAVAGGHAQHVPEGQAREELMRVRGKPVPEVVGDPVVQRQEPVVYQHADGDPRLPSQAAP